MPNLLHFGVLTWRPHLLKKVATKSPGFITIEEYTLDEANLTTGATQDKSKTNNQNLHPGNVEAKPTTPTVVKAKTAITLKTDTTNLGKPDTHCITTGNDRTSSPLQCKVTGSDTKPAEEDDIVFEPPIKQPQSALHVTTENEKLST